MIDMILEIAKENPVLTTAITAFLIETAAGAISDKWVPYIGIVRRILKKVAEKKTGGISVLLIFLLLSAGCAFSPQSNVCDTDQPSLICEKIPNPEQADLALQIVNVRSLKENAYDANQALEFLDKCEAYIDEAVTYGDVSKWIASELDEVDLEILILSNYLGVFDVASPIYDYDRMLLKEHIQRQKELIVMYMER